MAKKRRSPANPLPDEDPLTRIDRPLTLIAQVEQTLRKAITDGVFPGERLPTTVELADQLGVSRETVRLALESLQTEGLLIKHRRRGTFVNPPQSPSQLTPAAKVVGYLQADYSSEKGSCDVVSRTVSSCMFDGALVEAGNAGYQMVARSSRIPQLRHAFDELSSQISLRGAIFASVAEEKLIRRLSGRNLPVVLLDHDLHLPKVSSVVPDSFGRGKMAVEYLASLGHRRIALAHWQQPDLNPWLLRGYREGMRAAGLRCRRAWEMFVPINPEGAAEVVNTIQSAPLPPTAVICFSNALAHFVVDAAWEKGLQTPQDLSIVGGGGGDVIGLTCTQLDWYELGRSAMAILLRAIAEGDTHQPVHEKIPYVLKEGRTTAPPA
ncbi:GntR family transcriptional regulator [Lignipirellula cremea]|uniref:HTH-type transcriptional repressor CytR n=1 Tax=Lignipirellula cremea TaxID=2528010 RepID=A0A518DUX5_9BACT|nr:GntR family transcriptional regulator [Lignipirellula cremea]QDU95633.1 HTH-type transcriptional repressor CytR [Lignipirellula cremea]